MRHVRVRSAVALLLIVGCSNRDHPAGTRDVGPRDSGGPVDAAMDAGGNDDTGVADIGVGGDSGVEDVGMAALVPDPGTGTGLEWTDVEPNDDPSHAVPQGILAGPVWMGFAMPFTAINSATDVDFFVFRTGDAASLDNDFIGTCWGDGVDLANLYLYQVDNGVQGALIASAESTDTTCETVVGFGQGSTLLAADTVYLLEVRAAPGLVLTGTGMYSA